MYSYDCQLIGASGGTGRRAGFRCLCPQGCEGSSPSSRTQVSAGSSGSQLDDTVGRGTKTYRVANSPV